MIVCCCVVIAGMLSAIAESGRGSAGGRRSGILVISGCLYCTLPPCHLTRHIAITFLIVSARSPTSYFEVMTAPRLVVGLLVTILGSLAAPASTLSHSPEISDRKAFLRQSSAICAAALSAPLVSSPKSAIAEPLPMPRQQSGGTADQLQIGLLDSRVIENVMSPPPYGLEVADIVYPDWFQGGWDVLSVTTDVQAPCGQQLFGGNYTFANAKKEIGVDGALQYRARFVDGSVGTIADREFNVREIVKSAMGINSVVDVEMATPNKFSCLLSPKGASSVLSVDLLTLARRQETIDDKNFHCSEVVQQVVAPIDQSKPRNSLTPQEPSKTILLKEIETASLYTFFDNKTIKCIQRSATFLQPSQQDPIAFQLWQMSRGRPIDVRFYDVTYTRR